MLISNTTQSLQAQCDKCLLYLNTRHLVPICICPNRPFTPKENNLKNKEAQPLLNLLPMSPSSLWSSHPGRPYRHRIASRHRERCIRLHLRSESYNLPSHPSPPFLPSSPPSDTP
jgi:hypothetical protein